MNKLPEERPPFLGSWANVYTLVIVVLVLVIAGLYCFTKYFS
jgi:hypothetical protein